MVSRGYEAPITGKSNWITDEPNRVIGLAWLAILVVAILLTLQAAAYIAQAGLVAARPPLSPAQTALRIALGAGAGVVWVIRRHMIERVTLAMAVVAAASSALFGFGIRSPLLAAVRILSHLALYALAAVVAWRVLMLMRRESAANR